MSDYLVKFIEDDIMGSQENHEKKDEKEKKDENKKKIDKSKFLIKDDNIKVTFRYRGYPVEEIVIPKFKKNIDAIINKGIILYGPTETGKTRILRDFMHLTKLYFPIVFAFAPTNAEKHDYDAIIPKSLVFGEFELNNIKDIYLRQRSMTEIYNNANNLKILHSLFSKVASHKNKHFLKKLLNVKKQMIKKSERSCETLVEKKNKRDNVEEMFKTKLIRFYKYVIGPKVKILQSMELSQEEKYALIYRNLNPRVLIIFDDALTEVMSLLKEGKKQKDESLKNFFFKGRHANITHWYAFQDDNRLDSEIRKGAHISVFTGKQVALAYFTRPANNFSLLEKKKAEIIINTIFSEETAHKHTKLIYSRLDRNKFQYIVADEYADDDIQMCSKIVRKLCKKSEKKGENFDFSNPYFQRFKEGVD